jgi:hypothetical protein
MWGLSTGDDTGTAKGQRLGYIKDIRTGYEEFLKRKKPCDS